MPQPTPTTMRSQAKANRRAALLTAAAGLFAERGFNGVSIEELGTASGVTGPAVYRHFSGKQAVLAALLVGVSRTLLEGGQAVVDAAPDAAAALEGLVAFHVRFALSNRDVIRVQDRDLDSLEAPDRHTVRTLQRRYVELWVGVLERLGGSTAGEDAALLRIRAQAVFGLINSTPHSVRGGVDEESVRALLERIALAALTA
ncbi:TetR/AcrR family transcriptional regulator [Diaminobutyricimonas sp. LJ205]|uniref:TetR/AcrR family transcriptional regulator n=1 Tax=Diaminobutyricimonas sp. LJ205 TaxID=2683590 RepID=UPI0012F4CF7F|nr:TetR/AcrR family transcriptional regulator [Diaminobutyricimonas sp. LJ205]